MGNNNGKVPSLFAATLAGIVLAIVSWGCLVLWMSILGGG